MSVLNAFTTQLINFFDELCAVFPEEKDIKMATEGLKGVKKINPRLMLDLFVDHVYNDCSTAIYEKNAQVIQQVAQVKIASQFNEMLSALSLFDKHWYTLSPKNQNVIWQYLQVLCKLAEKAKDIKV
jgi:hypothetical protein